VTVNDTLPAGLTCPGAGVESGHGSSRCRASHRDPVTIIEPPDFGRAPNPIESV
jgi:hypothetical protein